MSLYFPVFCMSHLWAVWSDMAILCEQIVLPCEEGTNCHGNAIRNQVKTSHSSTIKHDSFEPHWEEIHGWETRQRNEKIGKGDQDGDFLCEEEWCHDGLRSDPEFDDDKEEEEYTTDDDRDVDKGVGPL